MKDFSRSKVRELLEQLTERLNPIGEELGVQFSLGSCSFSTDSFTVKVTGKAVEDGEVVVDDSTHHYADSFAVRNGVSYSAPHIIGSIWKLRDKVYKVTDFKPRNRKYPFIIVNEEGEKLRTTPGSLNKEIKMPTPEEFHTWWTVDPDDDACSRVQEEICDRVYEYLCGLLCDSPFWDDFWAAATDIEDKGYVERVWGEVYKLLFGENTGINECVTYMKVVAKWRR